MGDAGAGRVPAAGERRRDTQDGCCGEQPGSRRDEPLDMDVVRHRSPSRAASGGLRTRPGISSTRSVVSSLLRYPGPGSRSLSVGNSFSSAEALADMARGGPPMSAMTGLQSASMNAAVAEDTIGRAGRALIDAASAPAKVILFGSRARGDANDRSDFDFLVVEREVADRFAETARLGRVLGRLLIPADVVVVSKQYAEKW